MSDRNLVEVIDQMMAALPQNELTLCLLFRAIRSRSLYAAPELQPRLWAIVASQLRAEFGDVVPQSGWEGDVCRIFRGDAIQ